MIKEIEGYEGLYGVSDAGNVYSLKTDVSRRKRRLKPHDNKTGYLRVNLYDQYGKCKHHYIHRLVAKAFCENPDNFNVVNHISADKKDNSAKNLEWCDTKHNIKASRDMGHQNKDIPVDVTFPDGTVKHFVNMSAASIYVFGSRFSIPYLRKMRGNEFDSDGYHFLVRNKK